MCHKREISVIIPTYKPGNYLEDCLLSLSRQTLSSTNFEIIIVLNGPEDFYLQKIKTITLKLFTTVSCNVIHTNLRGVSNARNIGIDLSRGNYICFIDDDDVVSENYLESLLNSISGHNDSISVSNVYTFKDSIEEYGKDYLTKAFFKLSDNNLFTNRRFLSTACCKIIPKSVIGDFRFNTNYKRGEDALFMFSISHKIKKILKATDDTIYYRRIRMHSASRSKERLSLKFSNSFNLMMSYSKLYLSETNYNIWLYLSRLFAIFYQLIRK